MSDYKAIIFDLDGTAMPNAKHALPSPRLIAAVNSASKHIHLCAATGRPLPNAVPVLTALGLKDPCVIAAGTQIIDPISNETLWEVIIQPDDVRRALKACSPYPYEVIADNESIGEGGPAASRTIPKRVNVMYVLACTPADAEAMLQKLADIEDITAAGVTSWTQEGVDIHITHREATKEHAIAELLKRLQLNKEETIGVGDANNDVHLFRAVGKKVAMGNATDLLKSQADEVCDSIEGDGLAKLIERYSGKEIIANEK